MAVTTEAAAALWWDARFSAFGERIPFKSLFFPLLLQTCDEQQQQQLSQDELAALVKHCVAENAWMHGFVTKRDFIHFVARFGPVELTIAKVVSCFCVNGELVPWFHGLLGRADADRVLATTPSSTASGTTTGTVASSGDGSFLIRFSESHPSKFTLSYVKVHASGPHTGRREMKNCLIENLGRQGYALSDSRARTYTSILSFVQRSAGRLKHGVPSAIAKRCNTELAQIRALQDQQSNSYTTFSAETFDLSSSTASSPSASDAPQRLGRALLFAKSPPQTPPSMRSTNGSSNSGSVGGGYCADSYSGFSLDALTPVLSVTTKSVAGPRAAPMTAAADGSDDVYGDAGHFFDDQPVKENNQQGHNVSASVVATLGSKTQHQPLRLQSSAASASADYGCFQSSVVLTPPATQRKLLSPSGRPPLTGFTHLLSPSRRQHLQQCQAESSAGLESQHQEDAYGTFESFTSTFGGDSEELARRNRLAMSFAKSNLAASSSSVISTTSTMSLSTSSTSFGGDDAYGSFASLAITRPANGGASTFTSSNDDDDDDYGSFASLVDERDSAFQLGPPPPPPLGSRFSVAMDSSAPVATRAVAVNGVGSYELPCAVTTRRDSGGDSDVYGSFAALASPPSTGSSSSNSNNDTASTLSSVLLDSVDRRVSPPPDTRFFPLETKSKQPAVLAQASTDTLPPPPSPPLPEHTHSAACSALEELNAGMVCYQQRRLDDALARFTHAQQVAKATDDKVVEARALGNLGTVYLDKQNAAQAVVCYQRCLDITRSIKDAKRERTILNNLVLALMASEQFDRALACCAVQLEMTTHDVNRRKIYSRMSLLREKAARASRERQTAAASAAVSATAARTRDL